MKTTVLPFQYSALQIPYPKDKDGVTAAINTDEAAEVFMESSLFQMLLAGYLMDIFEK